MLRTLVGYTGGEMQRPTYRQLGNHAEALRLEYDPAVVSYARLLEIFWESHDPTTPVWSTQYANILFYHDESQKQAAEASLKEAERRLGRRIHTALRPAVAFWPAEDYHQKYYLRRFRGVVAALERYYPEPARLFDSTAAARCNAFAAGHGTRDELKALLPDLGLDEDAGRELLRALRP